MNSSNLFSNEIEIVFLLLLLLLSHFIETKCELFHLIFRQTTKDKLVLISLANASSAPGYYTHMLIVGICIARVRVREGLLNNLAEMVFCNSALFTDYFLGVTNVEH